MAMRKRSSICMEIPVLLISARTYHGDMACAIKPLGTTGHAHHIRESPQFGTGRNALQNETAPACGRRLSRAGCLLYADGLVSFHRHRREPVITVGFGPVDDPIKLLLDRLRDWSNNP